MTEWGPALTGPECKQLRLPGDTFVRLDGECWNPGDTASSWGFVCPRPIYCLLADHPAYKVAEYNRNHPDAPMVYHDGSKEAPNDWERGNDALMRNGDTIRIVSYWTHREHHAWGSADGEGDIIGYVPTPVEEADTVTLKRMTRDEWLDTCEAWYAGNQTSAEVDAWLGFAQLNSLIREETLLEQFEREEGPSVGKLNESERKLIRHTIEWMEKRQGDKP